MFSLLTGDRLKAVSVKLTILSEDSRPKARAVFQMHSHINGHHSIRRLRLHLFWNLLSKRKQISYKKIQWSQEKLVEISIIKWLHTCIRKKFLLIFPSNNHCQSLLLHLGTHFLWIHNTVSTFLFLELMGKYIIFHKLHFSNGNISETSLQVCTVFPFFPNLHYNPHLIIMSILPTTLVITSICVDKISRDLLYIWEEKNLLQPTET